MGKNKKKNINVLMKNQAYLISLWKKKILLNVWYRPKMKSRLGSVKETLLCSSQGGRAEGLGCPCCQQRAPPGAGAPHRASLPGARVALGAPEVTLQDSSRSAWPHTLTPTPCHEISPQRVGTGHLRLQGKATARHLLRQIFSLLIQSESGLNSTEHGLCWTCSVGSSGWAVRGLWGVWA